MFAPMPSTEGIVSAEFLIDPIKQRTTAMFPARNFLLV